MQTTGGHASWLNGKIERPHQTLQKMFNAAILDSGHSKDKWCLACENTIEIYNSIRHSATMEEPNFLWFKIRSSIHDYRVWGCEVYVKNYYAKASDDGVIRGYFMVYTTTRCIIRWWNPATNLLSLATGVRFNEVNFQDTDGNIAPGCLLHATSDKINIEQLPQEMVDTPSHPFLDSPPRKITITLPPLGTQLGVELQYCEYYKLTYIIKTTLRSHLYTQLPSELRYNVWIVAVNEQEPITVLQSHSY